MLDEILTRDFDEHTTNGHRVFNYSDLTSGNAFGPDGTSEVISSVDSSRTDDFLSKARFDDVDDYNGYRRMAWNSRLGWFPVSVSVKYVSETDPNTESIPRTYYKRITVVVTHPNMMTDQNGNVVPLTMQDLSIYRRYF